MSPPIRFALNHMVAPRLDHAAFFDLAARLGLTEVEIRNDLPGVAIADGTSPAAVRAAAAARGLTIRTINALQRFNDWDRARAEEAKTLAGYAQAGGAGALVLVPVNDRAWQKPEAERLAGLRRALEGLAPILSEAGLTGLVEPLGFAECALRSKGEAVAAIREAAPDGPFRLVHDTFHHHVAGETAMQPGWTGLVHISGVDDPTIPVGQMRDPHRVLVDDGDRIDNVGQIRALLGAGYAGPFSFEPFAPRVHDDPDVAAALGRSMAFIRARLQEN